MSRSRFWIICFATAFVVFAIPLIVAGAVSGNAPEIRLIRTGTSISALIVTNSARLLVINGDDRGEVRSALGRFSRPWEPTATVVVSPATNDAAIGLWEVLRDPRIKHVIVVGLPGSDPLWTHIENLCADRDVHLEYVASASAIDLEDALLAIEPDTSSLALKAGNTVVSMSLGTDRSTTPSHVDIVHTWNTHVDNEGVLITTSLPEILPDGPLLLVREREMVRLILAGSAIRVQGGHFMSVSTAPN